MTGNVRPESLERITTPELAKKFIDEQIAAVKEQVGESGKVLLALSGGVDSSVCAALISKAIGNRLICVHVNHGLLRKGEPEQVCKVFGEQFESQLIYVDAVDRFLDALAGVADPEQKRKIIGKIFIDVFAEEAKKLDGIEFLGQGTIYPDILESGPVKSHHNVGGLPEELNFRKPCLKGRDHIISQLTVICLSLLIFPFKLRLQLAELFFSVLKLLKLFLKLSASLSAVIYLAFYSFLPLTLRIVGFAPQRIGVFAPGQ